MNSGSPPWCAIVGSVRREFADLSETERRWIEPRLTEIAALQEELHALFLGARGAKHCRECLGLCCDCGRNHLTLANLLGLLLDGTPLPEPDFSRTCPFLSSAGCLLDVRRRPFNCITFFCETVDGELPAAARQRFGDGERRLRELYESFDRRYAGSSLRGLFIRAERLGGRPFLERL
ncbi:MAG TPA: hypothetical protein VJ955_07195 [Desulfuromonadales bacterium]|nr:hypothetical protein [Desulfuromonadales bacterium]